MHYRRTRGAQRKLPNLMVTFSILTIKNVRMAIVLADLDDTYPVPGAALLVRLQPAFPSLPIMLVSPRVSGFSRSYATFDVVELVRLIDTSSISWTKCRLVDMLPIEELPF